MTVIDDLPAGSSPSELLNPPASAGLDDLKHGRPVNYRYESNQALPIWPLLAMIVGYPIWFLAGLGGFMWVAFSIPMAVFLIRRRTVVAPKGIGWWALFLLAVLGSAISVDTAGRAMGYVLRLGYYLGATAFLLYLLNATKLISAGRIVRAFTMLWFATVAGGYLALVLGDFTFASPMAYLLPRSLATNDLISALVNPGFADVQDFIGFPVPRPKAPFPFTNSWGSMMGLLTPFGIMALSVPDVGIPRRYVRITLIASVVPIVISLNRGLWLSLVVAALYVAVRLGIAGHAALLAKLGLGVAVLVAVVVFSPLGDLFSSRIDNGHSDADRTELAVSAVEGAIERPIFGWGTPRPNVRNLPPIGTHGQVWMVLFSHGFVGGLGWFGAFGTFLWRTRRQHSVGGLWAHTVLLVALVQMPVYLLIPHSLFTVMGALAVALRLSNEPSRPIPIPSHLSP